MTTISTLLGLFNIAAGLMTVTALLLFIGGFIQYLALLGTERRKLGLTLMYRGVEVLFVLVILMGIVDVLQGPLAFLLGMALVLFLAFVVVLSVSKASPAKKKEEH